MVSVDEERERGREGGMGLQRVIRDSCPSRGGNGALHGQDLVARSSMSTYARPCRSVSAYVRGCVGL